MHRSHILRRHVSPVIAFTAIGAASLVVVGTLFSTASASGAVLAASGSTAAAASDTAPTAPAQTGAPLTSSTIRTATSAEVFAGGPYRNPSSEAATASQSLASSGDTAGAADAQVLAAYPTAIWLGDWFSDAQLASTVQSALAGAARTGTTPVFVTYAIPDRDCGSYSAGGYSPAAYRAWSARIAGLLAGHRAVVLVEPDSLALLTDCPATASTRLPLIADQVHELAAVGVPTYLDAGNSHWNPASVMAERLQQAGIAEARGFFTNVSNYYPTADEHAYAEQLSGLLGGAHYVIDTSRNGTGWTGTWCNAQGAGLGTAPAVVGDGTGLDALLWVKPPGASDGECNGGPAAGSWYPAAARMLLANRAP